MKKLSGFAVILVLTLILSACGGQTAQIGGGSGNKQTTVPGTDEEKTVTLNARIVENNGKSLLVCGATASELSSVSINNAVLLGEDGKSIAAESLVGGMSVAIEYNGNVLETYPMQIQSATKITVTAKKDDVISLYTEALTHLYNENSALNGGLIAVDLTRAVSMTEGEKAALIYLLGNKLSENEVEVIASTREELNSNGTIEKTNSNGADFYTFKDGALITVSDKGASNGKITFDIVKWHSSLAAVGYNGSTGECKDGKWTITYGETFAA